MLVYASSGGAIQWGKVEAIHNSCPMLVCIMYNIPAEIMPGDTNSIITNCSLENTIHRLWIP